MRRTTYTEDFERLWNAFDSRYGEKGSKKNAFKVFLDLEINPDDVDYIIERLEKQKLAKDHMRARGIFTPPFQHVERYLKNERFDDEIGGGFDRLTASERADAQTAAYLRTLRGDIPESAQNAENVLEFRSGKH